MSIQDLTLGLVETAKRIAEDSAAYKKFFNDSLKKFGVTSPEELSAEKKKEFYNHIDANWNSDDEPGSDGKKDKPKKDVDEGKGMPPWLKKGKKDDKDSEDEVKEEHDEEDEDEDEEEVEEGLNAQYKKDLKTSACKSEEIKEEDWSKMGDRSKDWTRRQYQKAVAAGDKERAKDFIDTYGRGVTKKVGHGQDAQGKEIGKFGDKAFKKRIDNIKKKKDDKDSEDEVKENKYVGGYRDSSRDGQQGPSSKPKPKPKSNNSQEDSIRSEIERLYKQRDIADAAASKARESGNDNKADHMEDKGNEISRKIRELKDKLKDKNESNTLDANLLERVLKELNIG